MSMDFEATLWRISLILRASSPNWSNHKLVNCERLQRGILYMALDSLACEIRQLNDQFRFARLLNPSFLRVEHRSLSSDCVRHLGFDILLRSLVIPENFSKSSRHLGALMRTRCSCFVPTRVGDSLHGCVGEHAGKRSFLNPSIVPSQTTVLGQGPQHTSTLYEIHGQTSTPQRQNSTPQQQNSTPQRPMARSNQQTFMPRQTAVPQQKSTPQRSICVEAHQRSSTLPRPVAKGNRRSAYMYAEFTPLAVQRPKRSRVD